MVKYYKWVSLVLALYSSSYLWQTDWLRHCSPSSVCDWLSDLGTVIPHLSVTDLGTSPNCLWLTDWPGHCRPATVWDWVVDLGTVSPHPPVWNWLADWPDPPTTTTTICVWLTDLGFVVHSQGVLLGVVHADAGQEEVNDEVDSLIASSGQCCGGTDSIVQVHQLAFQVWKGQLQHCRRSWLCPPTRLAPSKSFGY